MKNKILISESQYKRIFLKESDSTDIIILPGPNAGQIQQFLKNKGFYKGIVDYNFKDKSAEAFAKYYGGASLGWVKTLKELYTELKVMRYPVGEKYGFGLKMAKVISDLIKKKETNENPGKTFVYGLDSKNLSSLTDKEKNTVWDWVRNMDKPENAKKLNISQKEGEFCKPCFGGKSNSELNTLMSKEDMWELINMYKPATNLVTPDNPYPLKNSEEVDDNPYRWYGGGDSRYTLPTQVSCIDCHRVVGFMGNYYDLTQAQRERYHLTLMTAGQYEPAFVKYIYDIFDCSELWYSKDGVFSEKFLDYTQCIADNLSMGASTIPLVGPVISAVFDGVNAVVYEARSVYHGAMGGYYTLTGQETKAKSEMKKSALNAGFSLLSALGVIPGVTEAKMIKKYYNATQNVAKKTDNITQKLSKEPLSSMGNNERREVVNKIIDEGTEGMTKEEKKQVLDLVNSFGNPKNIKTVERMEKFAKKSEEFQKMYKLSKYEYIMLLNSNEFNKLLKESSGDVFKALTHKRIKSVVTNVVTQLSLGVAASEGITAGVNKYREWSLEDDAEIGKPYAIVELEGYPWIQTRDVFFMSDKSSEENNLLIAAWKAGWRPWPKKNGKAKEYDALTDEELRYHIEWLMKPENKKYRSKKMQKHIEDLEKEAIEKYDVKQSFSDEQQKKIDQSKKQGYERKSIKMKEKFDSVIKKKKMEINDEVWDI